MVHINLDAKQIGLEIAHSGVDKVADDREV
jgi:hypothetical protein